MKAILTTKLLLTLLVLLLLIDIIRMQSYESQGIGDAIMDFMFDDDTCYAHGYSESGFREIKKGMIANEVVRLIGAPLSIGKYCGIDYKSAWVYSKPCRNSHYRVRVVIFMHGTVVKKDSSFYVD